MAFAMRLVLGIEPLLSGFSTFLQALKNQATWRQALPGGDLAGLSGSHQQTCPQPTGITWRAVDKIQTRVFCIPVSSPVLVRLQSFFALFGWLFETNSALPKKWAYPT
jgi:hypothetical protein